VRSVGKPIVVRVHPAQKLRVTVSGVVKITNTTKHAKASYVEVTVEERDGALHLRVRDDGAGGADLRRGSGLIGLHDRVEALAGTIVITSPTGQGTTIEVALPLGA
jgi:signal transduction histidine kinase